MTMGQGGSKEKVEQFGEVFTPPQMTFEMLMMPEVRDALTALDKPICDPCVGQGQFPATQLVLRMFYNLDRLDERSALHALYTLYGVDIQEESIDECKAHMLATFCDAYEFFTGREVPLNLLRFATSIIEHNFVVGDSISGWEKSEPKSKKRAAKESVQLSLF